MHHVIQWRWGTDSTSIEAQVVRDGQYQWVLWSSGPHRYRDLAELISAGVPQLVEV